MTDINIKQVKCGFCNKSLLLKHNLETLVGHVSYREGYIAKLKIIQKRQSNDSKKMQKLLNKLLSKKQRDKLKKDLRYGFWLK